MLLLNYKKRKHVTFGHFLFGSREIDAHWTAKLECISWLNKEGKLKGANCIKHLNL